MTEVNALATWAPQMVNVALNAGASSSAPLPAANWSSDGISSFSDLVVTGLNTVNSKLNASELNLQRLAVGDVQNLHEVMIALEESRLSFQLLMQVRARLLEAYQDVMRMQV